MEKRLLIVARDFNAAQHWAKEQRMTPGRWVYVSSYHNIQGNAGNPYIKLEGWLDRPDAGLVQEMLNQNMCVERT